MSDPLKTLLVNLALDPDLLSKWRLDRETVMAAAGVDRQDQELIRSGIPQALMDRLSTDGPSGVGACRSVPDEEPAGAAELAGSKGSLVIVGTGIRAVGQLTVEAISHIKNSERVFYLVAEPVAVEVIRTLNPCGSRSLADLYAEGKPRRETYAAMVERIVTSVRAGRRTCAVFYGHPGVFVDAAHAAIKQAREEGFAAEMLAGISAEDCLFADLGIDPATAGCQSYEAMDYLVNHRQVDPTSHLVLWQIGVLGDRTFSLQVRESNALALLVGRLTETYPANHRVCVYEAAVLPDREAVVKWMELRMMEKSRLSIVSTLYVPPSEPPRVDLPLYFVLTGAG